MANHTSNSKLATHVGLFTAKQHRPEVAPAWGSLRAIASHGPAARRSGRGSSTEAVPAVLRTGQKAFIAALCSSFNEETYSSEESAVTAASTLLLPPLLFGHDAAGSLSELRPGCGGRRLFADWSYLKKGSQTGAFKDGSATYTDTATHIQISQQLSSLAGLIWIHRMQPFVTHVVWKKTGKWNRGLTPIGTMQLHIVREH